MPNCEYAKLEKNRMNASTNLVNDIEDADEENNQNK
jgi:hypothetical protein